MSQKVCKQCGAEKSFADFYRDARNPDGLIAVCKPCHIARTRAWQARNADKFAEMGRRRHRENVAEERAALRSWRERNRERYRANEREWRAKNSVSLYARNAKRTAAQKQATPPWADRAAIARIYADARRISIETGVPHHVDHILPLCGKTVSGLHVPANLRVIPASENVRKQARILEAA